MSMASSGKSEQLFLQTWLLAGSSINDEYSLIILLITCIVLAEKKYLQFSNTPFLLVCLLFSIYHLKSRLLGGGCYHIEVVISVLATTWVLPYIVHIPTFSFSVVNWKLWY